MPLSFRDASAADAPLLAELNRQLIRDEGHRNSMPLAELEIRTRQWLASGEYSSVLFERDGMTAGYALFRREADHVYLRQPYVLPEFRRAGIGRAAIDWLCRHRWQDAPRLRIDVLVGNVAAREFWKSVGFAEYCVTMERDLSVSEGRLSGRAMPPTLGQRAAT
jgi:GNAT superfamily N-acetyltransferase